MRVGTSFVHRPAMLTLLSIGILVAMLVAVVVAHAVATAPEGYEDDVGFHVIDARARASGSAAESGGAAKCAPRDLPSVVVSR